MVRRVGVGVEVREYYACEVQQGTQAECLQAGRFCVRGWRIIIGGFFYGSSREARRALGACCIW